MVHDATKKIKHYATAEELLKAVTGKPVADLYPPIDIDTIIRKLGITVNYEMFLETPGVLGSIAIVDGNVEITVNSAENTYQPRKRFTLAHEIAHYCLHLRDTSSKFVDTRKSMDRNGSYWNPQEFEANAFAAELLMPKDLILRFAREVIDDYRFGFGADRMPTNLFVEKMAKLFNVSIQAMEIKLRSLKFF